MTKPRTHAEQTAEQTTETPAEKTPRGRTTETPAEAEHRRRGTRGGTVTEVDATTAGPATAALFAADERLATEESPGHEDKPIDRR